MGAAKSRPGTDHERQIKGYASTDSVALGDAIDFHIAVEPAGSFTVSVYRLGYYAGTSARRVLVSPTLTAAPQPVPTPDPETGRIGLEWPVAWTLDIPKDWTSGTYVAVLDKADGFRNRTARDGDQTIRHPEHHHEGRRNRRRETKQGNQRQGREQHPNREARDIERMQATREDELTEELQDAGEVN